MSKPECLIDPNEVVMLEIGIRLQQLLILHPYAVQWREPHACPDQYRRLIDKLRQRIRALGDVPAPLAQDLDEACFDLTEFWCDAVENRFDGTWVTPEHSSIVTQVAKIAGLIATAFSPSDTLAVWYRVGRYAAAGRVNADGNWALDDEAAFDQHVSALPIGRTDLFSEPTSTDDHQPYPDEFRGWVLLDAGIVKLATVAANVIPGGPPEVETASEIDGQPKRAKRSTESGAARAKLVAALTEHHRYNNRLCEPNYEPIGVGELARKADVGKATASEFFKKQFGSHASYRAGCRDTGKLRHALTILNGELTPSILFNPLPDDGGEYEPTE